MPLKLNVGLSKKIGLPDFGSLGASCHVEVELDGALLRTDLDGFHKGPSRLHHVLDVTRKRFSILGIVWCATALCQ